MNDFKKGLAIGMLIIIGCGTFIASSSNDDVGRYELYNEFGSGKRVSLLDTKTGVLYHLSRGDEWTKRQSIPIKDK